MFLRQWRRIRALDRVGTSTWAEVHAKELYSYELVHLRTLEQNALLWQTPTLALTAQAFLLTIALGSDTSASARYLAAGLGVVVAALAMQLMAKHLFLYHLDKAYLTALEQRIGLDGIAKHAWPSTVVEPRKRPAAAIRSYVLWQAGLATFGVANLGIIAAEWAQ